MAPFDDRAVVTTTRTSLELVEQIRRKGGARVKELAEGSEMAASTVHRHLVTLERYGYVQRYGDRFQLGLKFVDLSESARSQWPLETITDTVTALSEETEEEVDFFTVDRGRLITLDRTYRRYHKLVKYGEEEPDDGEDRHTQVGNYYYMHVLAAGKAILAEYPTSRVDRVVDRWGLPAKTGNTITGEGALLDELERTRERGYAVDDEEYTPGLRTVGTVVHNPNGGVFGALNVAGPRYRMTGVVLEEEIPRRLADASAELEEALSDQSVMVRQQPLGPD